MSKIYGKAESVESIAQGLIANFHGELGTARILYCFSDSVGTKGGRERGGVVRKFTGFLQWVLDQDFCIEIGLDKWNDLTENQRIALVDHLLSRCTGEENEETGEMKWKVREPDVQEFSEVLHRQGAWNEELQGFVSVAQSIKIDAILVEEGEVSADDLVDVTTSEN